MKPLCSAISITLVGGLILGAAGCEDPDARQRDQAQARLTQLRNDLRQALAKGGDTPEAYQSSLNQIVSALDAMGGGETGQQAAKALLAAEALREIAGAHAAAAMDIEVAHLADLAVADAQVDAALRLHALASGRGSFDVNQLRASIQSQVEGAQQTAAVLREQIAALEGPINERTSKNQVDSQQIEQLRVQVGNLLRDAQERGYADGLDLYLEAKQLNRQADKIEYDVSHREIDLDHDLAPQHRMAVRQLEQVEAMIQALEAAGAQIETYSTATAADSQASRAKIEELAGQINATLAKVKSESDGALASAYEASLAALERAAASAARAGGGAGPAANSAKIVSAGVHEAVARTHLAAARGLTDRLTLLMKIKQAGGVIPVAGLDSQISDLYSAIEKHTTDAKTSLESATQALDGVSGGSAEVEAFRANLLSLSNTLSGASAPGESSANAPGDVPSEPAPEPSPAPDAPAAPPSSPDGEVPAEPSDTAPDGETPG
jgi:hypothetical protein